MMSDGVWTHSTEHIHDQTLTHIRMGLLKKKTDISPHSLTVGHCNKKNKNKKTHKKAALK